MVNSFNTLQVYKVSVNYIWLKIETFALAVVPHNNDHIDLLQSKKKKLKNNKN